MLIVGGAGYLLLKAGAIGVADMPSWTPGLLILIAVAGFAVLCVGAGGWAYTKFQQAQSEASELAAKQAQQKSEIKTGNQNIDVLTYEEAEALAFVLRGEKQRFPGRVTRSPAGLGLVNKKVLFPTETKDVWQVNPEVWARSEELIERYKRIPQSTRSPWTSHWMA